jgi:hypothetical protein
VHFFGALAETLQAFEFTEIKTDFEFLVNSNSYLCVTRAYLEL